MSGTLIGQALGALLEDQPKKRNALWIYGRRTSLSLERHYWEELDHIAARHKIAVSELVSIIDKCKHEALPLTTATRLFVLNYLARR